MNRLTIVRPDDWHLHLRDGAEMKSVVAFSAERFSRAIVMPNLGTPVVTTDQALAYRRRILDAIPDDLDFDPLMTIYLTDNTPTDEIKRATESGKVIAVKFYPAGATTNSDAGVTSIKKTYPVLEAMSRSGMPLLVHGEVTDPKVDIFDRETVFIDRILEPLSSRFPDLKIVFEHVTTAEAVGFVRDSRDGIAATITAHHLLLDRNAMFTGGMRPHYYCLPVLKDSSDRAALLEAATSGSPRFFLGTDSAPHSRTAKESPCGCAGVFTAHAAIELYAEAFCSAGALDRLEAFASFHGCDFYGLPRNKDSITLTQHDWTVPESYPFGSDAIVPMRAGSTIAWRINETED